MDHLQALWDQLGAALRSIITPRSVRDIESAPERVTDDTPIPPPPPDFSNGEAASLREFRERREAIERRQRELARLYGRRRIEEN